MHYDITSVYYFIDDFCKIYEEWEHSRLLPSQRIRFRSGEMALSEMLTIVVSYHFSGYKCFKYFYHYEIMQRHRQAFPKLLSYNRFIQKMPSLFLPLHLLLHMLMGEKTGVYFIDSTALPVCHNRRIHRHKTFAGLAERGKTSMGWFFGLKLHIIINNKGQLMAAKITRGNVNDRTPVEELTASLSGLMAADKGYLSKELFKRLYNKGLKMLTGIRKGMKNSLIPFYEKLILRKRFLVETAFDTLKNTFNLSHTRHRSPTNACVNILAALVAYAYKTNKPALKNMNLIQN